MHILNQKQLKLIWLLLLLTCTANSFGMQWAANLLKTAKTKFTVLWFGGTTTKAALKPVVRATSSQLSTSAHVNQIINTKNQLILAIIAKEKGWLDYALQLKNNAKDPADITYYAKFAARREKLIKGLETLLTSATPTLNHKITPNISNDLQDQNHNVYELTELEEYVLTEQLIAQAQAAMLAPEKTVMAIGNTTARENNLVDAR